MEWNWKVRGLALLAVAEERGAAGGGWFEGSSSRAADSSEIGMGAIKSGLAMEYAWAVGKGEFWVTHSFTVGYPIHSYMGLDRWR